MMLAENERRAIVYSVGQRVKFMGGDAIVVKASKPKRDIFGRWDQTLHISHTYGMMTAIIGSAHRELCPVDEVAE